MIKDVKCLEAVEALFALRATGISDRLLKGKRQKDFGGSGSPTKVGDRGVGDTKRTGRRKGYTTKKRDRFSFSFSWCLPDVLERPVADWSATVQHSTYGFRKQGVGVLRKGAGD